MRDFDIDILDQMATRFNPLPLGDSFLNSRYDWQRDINGVEWPYYRFFYYLSEWLRPEVIIELGSYQGTAAAHFAAGCEDSLVITIDHHGDPDDEDNQALTLEAEARYPNLVYKNGWTNPIAANREEGKHKRNAESVFSEINDMLYKDNLRVDILFIDSWHTYENARLDWFYYKTLLKRGALVICDDIQGGEGADLPISGMMHFWEEMPNPKFLNFNLHPATGMGFVKYDYEIK